MELHEKIKLIRQLKGWSQEETAERLSIAASTYGSIERGETDVNLSRLQQIAKIFEMDLLNLVAWDKGTTFNFIGTDNTTVIGTDNTTDFCRNWHVNSSFHEREQLLHELEKKDLLLSQKDSEIEYLKQQNIDLREMVVLLKNSKSI